MNASPDTVACANVKCARDRSADDRREPCPDCGEARVTIHLRFHETLGPIADSLVTSFVPNEQDRDWGRRWRNLAARLVELEGMRTEDRGADAIHLAAQDLFDFFVNAYHLIDALIEDGAVKRTIAVGALKTNPTLQLLADIANTEKHRFLDVQTHPPKSGDAPVLTKVADTSAGEGWKLVAEFQHHGRLVDGVAFARTAFETWEMLLRDWGLI
jgi:hypothetical protein